MPRKWLSYFTLSLLAVASVALGCRAPYPTYNPYGFYGQPCVNPPGTGAYGPGRTDPYYGAPANGVYPPNPYAPGTTYPGYPPPQQPAGSTSKRTNWSPTVSTEDSSAPLVERSGADQKVPESRPSDVDNGQWTSVDNPTPTGESGPTARTAMLDTNSSWSGGSGSNIARFDGFGRN